MTKQNQKENKGKNKNKKEWRKKNFDPNVKEGVLVSPVRDKFFYYKKTPQEEVVIYPLEGIRLPSNRTRRVNKFIKSNSDILEAVIEDMITVKCTVPIGTEYEEGLSLLYKDRDEDSFSCYFLPKLNEPLKTVTNPKEETKMTASGLKVFYIITDQGFFFTTMDAVCKTAQFMVLDDKGYIGYLPISQGNKTFIDRVSQRVMTIRNLWPELNIRIVIRNGVSSIYVDPKAIHLDLFHTPGVINLDRHYNNEMLITQDYADVESDAEQNVEVEYDTQPDNVVALNTGE